MTVKRAAGAVLTKEKAMGPDDMPVFTPYIHDGEEWKRVEGSVKFEPIYKELHASKWLSELRAAIRPFSTTIKFSRSGFADLYFQLLRLLKKRRAACKAIKRSRRNTCKRYKHGRTQRTRS